MMLNTFYMSVLIHAILHHMSVITDQEILQDEQHHLDGRHWVLYRLMPSMVVVQISMMKINLEINHLE